MSEARLQKALDKVSAERDRMRDELQELRDYNAELRARVVELCEEVARLVNLRTICVEEELAEYLKYDKPLPGGNNE